MDASATSAGSVFVLSLALFIVYTGVDFWCAEACWTEALGFTCFVARGTLALIRRTDRRREIILKGFESHFGVTIKLATSPLPLTCLDTSDAL